MLQFRLYSMLKSFGFFQVTLEVKIIRRKLHADFRGRLPIRFAFYDFANPHWGEKNNQRERGIIILLFPL